MSHHSELAEKHNKQSYEESANWTNYQALLLIDNVKYTYPLWEGDLYYWVNGYNYHKTWTKTTP